MYCQLCSVPADRVKQLGASTPWEQLVSNAEIVSLEKAWHGLHYLLSGSAWDGEGPTAFLLAGGTEIDGTDDGYGASRLISVEETARIHAALAKLSDDDVWGRFNPQDMEAQSVYPGIWDEPEEDLREEYLSYLQELRQLLASAAEQRQALVVSLG
jgi:hypothetical protein